MARDAMDRQGIKCGDAGKKGTRATMNCERGRERGIGRRGGRVRSGAALIPRPLRRALARVGRRFVTRRAVRPDVRRRRTDRIQQRRQRWQGSRFELRLGVGASIAIGLDLVRLVGAGRVRRGDRCEAAGGRERRDDIRLAESDRVRFWTSANAAGRATCRFIPHRVSKRFDFRRRSLTVVRIERRPARSRTEVAV